MKKRKQNNNIKKRIRKIKTDTQQIKFESGECDDEQNLFEEQEDDTPREEPTKYVTTSNFSKWTSQDDLLLKDVIQVCRGNYFD